MTTTELRSLVLAARSTCGSLCAITRATGIASSRLSGILNGTARLRDVRPDFIARLRAAAQHPGRVAESPDLYGASDLDILLKQIRRAVKHYGLNQTAHRVGLNPSALSRTLNGKIHRRFFRPDLAARFHLALGITIPPSLVSVPIEPDQCHDHIDHFCAWLRTQTPTVLRAFLALAESHGYTSPVPKPRTHYTAASSEG